MKSTSNEPSPKKAPLGLLRHEDVLQPFVLHRSNVRGRMVRLSPCLNTILSRHDYPAPVSFLLAEFLTLAAMLSANLNEGGILTMQAKGSGPIKFIVVDCVHGGDLRGYASLAEGGEEALKALEHEGADAELSQLMGEGYVCITLDMGFGEPYQGIVPLEGDTISDAIEHYFTMSHQVDVLFNCMISKQPSDDGKMLWRAGGIMIERIPEEGGKEGAIPLEEQTRGEGVPSYGTKQPPVAELDEMGLRGWDYNVLLVNTTTPEELLDPHLAPSALLYRLFNEGGVWVNDTKPIAANCRCSRHKIATMLKNMGKESIEEMKENGVVTVTCQFCNSVEVFDDADLA